MNCVVDARGLLCPLPVIRIQDRAKDLPADTQLELIANDPGVIEDVPMWCRMHGHEVIDIQERKVDIRIRILLCKPDGR